ncbi:hypothetical protein PV327_002870 [Microctonus hyperodae]|uniref:Uncharacterized protein n=1 Tax=Microctonus hyperodae TaxID=165561 RepID=A0AA39FGF2_MICHY|nr:hypothetical protein PV327_002870 [Microctonus hyperodae]
MTSINIWATFIVTALCISLNRSAPQNGWVWPNQIHSTRDKQINNKTGLIISNPADKDENNNDFSSDNNNEILNTIKCGINEKHVTLNGHQSLYCDDYDEHKLEENGVTFLDNNCKNVASKNALIMDYKSR